MSLVPLAKLMAHVIYFFSSPDDIDAVIATHTQMLRDFISLEKTSRGGVVVVVVRLLRESTCLHITFEHTTNSGIKNGFKKVHEMLDSQFWRLNFKNTCNKDNSFWAF